MVILLVIALLMPAVVSADTIDEDGLRQLLAPSEAEHERRNTRSKVSGGLTVPVKRQPPVRELHSERSNIAVKAGDPPPATAPAESASAVSSATPQVTKYRVKKRNADGSMPAATTKQQRKRLPVDPDIYIPPPRIDTESTTHSQVYSQKSRTFGIVIGTWFSVTNADNGQVEVIIDEDVSGKTKTLPAGTTLFGQKAFNQVSQRLDLSLSNGITPDGFEFDLSATVYDSTKVSGLCRDCPAQWCVNGVQRSGQPHPEAHLLPPRRSWPQPLIMQLRVRLLRELGKQVTNYSIMNADSSGSQEF